MKYGLIAGNGRFPFLVLEGARARGVEMVVAAIKEETAPEIEREAARVEWVGVGRGGNKGGDGSGNGARGGVVGVGGGGAVGPIDPILQARAGDARDHGRT